MRVKSQTFLLFLLFLEPNNDKDYKLKWKGNYKDLHAAIKGKYIIKQHTSTKKKLSRIAKCKTQECPASILLIQYFNKDDEKSEEVKDSKDDSEDEAELLISNIEHLDSCQIDLISGFNPDPLNPQN